MREGPESIAEILARLFTQRGWGRQQEQRRWADAWRTVAGAELSGKTQPLALKRGVFEVAVADSVLLQELANFEKRRLLSGLQAALGSEKISDIRFRLGR